MDEIILRYLTKAFPIKKIKRKTKFKRAIEIYSDECYYLSDGTSGIKNRLETIVKSNFDCTKEEAESVVKKFLTL